METPLVLMNTGRINRSAKRMAYEIMEQNSSNHPIILFGIDQRGYAVAKLLEEVLANISPIEIKTVKIPVKEGNPEEIVAGLSSKDIEKGLLILVDDVIFSGRTMFEALNAIVNNVNPLEIHTAVLIDRGHRKLPIKAEYNAMELPTKLNERVAVVVEGTQIQEVVLEKN